MTTNEAREWMKENIGDNWSDVEVIDGVTTAKQKSGGGNIVWVQVPPPAPKENLADETCLRDFFVAILTGKRGKDKFVL